jgi:CheY-like chemotaxis protein
MASHATILLADDNPDDVELMKCAFQRAGLSNPVHVVSNGQEAVEYLKGAIEAKSSGYPIPLLISLDIRMPMLNGLEVLRWIKKQPELSEIPVLVVSQSEEPPKINRATHLGVNSYLVKPAHIDDLVLMMGTFKEIVARLEAKFEGEHAS